MERSEEANAVLSRDGESRQYGATGKPGRSPAPLKRVPTADGGSGARASGDPSQRGKQKTASAGAPRDAAATWARIDGHLARHHVRRLQVRIAKAVKARRWHKVCAWQYRLTRSFSAKLLAVKRVTSTPGRETPGSDGVRWQGVRATWRATMRLRRRGDKPKPLRRVDIPQKHGKQRPLSIPMLCAYCTSLLRRLGISVIQTMGLHEIDQAHPVERSSSPWATHDLASPCGSPLASRAFLSPPGALIVSPAWYAGPAAVYGPS